MQIKTVRFGVNGEGRLRGVVGELITASQWFDVTPYPSDLWIITVKEENERLLRRLIGESGGALITLEQRA